MATKKLAVWVLGSCLASAAFAQDIIVEPPTEGPGHLHPISAFKRVQIQTDLILSALTDMGGVTAQIESDLYSSNTLLEQTGFALDGLGVTTGLLATGVNHDLFGDVEGIETSLSELVDECNDESYACVGNTRTITVDGETASSSCFPYRCGLAGGCIGFCASDSDCSGGTHCAASACVSYAAPRCDYAAGHAGQSSWQILVVTGADQVSDCTPYVCDEGSCRDSCSTSEHCAAGTVCDTARGLCVYPLASGGGG